MEEQLLQRLKKFLKISNNDSDTRLLEICRIAAAFIFSETGISFYEKTFTETPSYWFKDSAGRFYFYAKHSPITEIVEVKLNDQVLDTSKVSVKNDKIILDSEIVISPQDSFSITYKIGYADISQINPDLISAFLLIGKKLFTDVTKNGVSLTRLSSDIRESATFSDEIPLVAKQILQSNKKIALI